MFSAPAEPYAREAEEYRNTIRHFPNHSITLIFTTRQMRDHNALNYEHISLHHHLFKTLAKPQAPLISHAEMNGGMDDHSYASFVSVL